MRSSHLQPGRGEARSSSDCVVITSLSWSNQAVHPPRREGGVWELPGGSGRECRPGLETESLTVFLTLLRVIAGTPPLTLL